MQNLGHPDAIPEESQHTMSEELHELRTPGITIVVGGITTVIPKWVPREAIHEMSLLLERVYLMETADGGGQ